MRVIAQPWPPARCRRTPAAPCRRRAAPGRRRSIRCGGTGRGAIPRAGVARPGVETASSRVAAVDSRLRAPPRGAAPGAVPAARMPASATATGAAAPAPRDQRRRRARRGRRRGRRRAGRSGCAPATARRAGRLGVVSGGRLGGVPGHRHVDRVLEVDRRVAGVGGAQRLAAEPAREDIAHRDRLAQERLGGGQVAGDPGRSGRAPSAASALDSPGGSWRHGDQARRRRARRVEIALGADGLGEIAARTRTGSGSIRWRRRRRRLLLQLPGPGVSPSLDRLTPSSVATAPARCAPAPGALPGPHRAIAGGGVVAEAVEVTRYVEIDQRRSVDCGGQRRRRAGRPHGLLAVAGRAMDAAQRPQQARAPARWRGHDVGKGDRPRRPASSASSSRRS